MLDGVRGAAILLVLMFHATASHVGASGRLDTIVRRSWSMGWTGVDLFFVLSGMLITGILLDTKDGVGYFRSFYARRTLRIFPLYYAALAILLGVLPLVARRYMHGSLSHTAALAWLFTYTSNIAIARADSWNAVPTLTGLYWSLAVEEQFYLVWPLLVWWLSRRALARTAVGMLVVALGSRVVLDRIGGFEKAIYVLLVTRMDTLAVGALIALAARSVGGLARWAPSVRAVGAASGLGLLAILGVTRRFDGTSPLMHTVGFTCVAFAFGALLVHVLAPGGASGIVARVLRARWLGRLGARSYGVYIWHSVFLLALLQSRAVARIPVIRDHEALGVFATLVLVTGLGWATAELSWRVLEAPFLRLKRYVPRPAAASRAAPGRAVRPDVAQVRTA